MNLTEKRKTFGERLNLLRRSKNISKDKLIQDLNALLIEEYQENYIRPHIITRNEYDRYENGELLPNQENLMNICKILKKPLDWFFSPMVKTKKMF